MHSFVRRVLRRESALHQKLRKAVAQQKPRLVADLLHAGASPTWMEHSMESASEMNALLLACHYGDVQILNLLLDSFFDTPQLLQIWGRHMYCIVIRRGHWEAFQRLHERRVPMDPSGSLRSKLPAPAFVAAEAGQREMLQFLVQLDVVALSGYSFNGHSLLSIASKNGQYECVQVLMELLVVSDETLDFALEIARQHHQPHVLVLLTSCLPEFSSGRQPVMVRRLESAPVSSSSSSSASGASQRRSGSRGGRGSNTSLLYKPRRSSVAKHQRGSLAETEILSDYGNEDEENGSGSGRQLQRHSDVWLYKSDQDLNVYHPYVGDEDDGSEMAADDFHDARHYQDYIRGLEESLATDVDQDWHSTPPVALGLFPVAAARDEATKTATEQQLEMIATQRESIEKPKKSQSKKTWYYRNEVILPYDDSDTSDKATPPSTTTTTTMQSSHDGSPAQAPPSSKPQLPPASNFTRRVSSTLYVSPAITQISRKLISVRSKSMQAVRAST